MFWADRLAGEHKEVYSREELLLTLLERTTKRVHALEETAKKREVLIDKIIERLELVEHLLIE